MRIGRELSEYKPVEIAVLLSLSMKQEAHWYKYNR